MVEHASDASATERMTAWSCQRIQHERIADLALQLYSDIALDLLQHGDIQCPIALDSLSQGGIGQHGMVTKFAHFGQCVGGD